MFKRHSLRDKIIPILLGLVITCFALWMQITQHSGVQAFIQGLDNLVYDFRLKQTLKFQSYPKSPVVIVDIDEQSLQAEGRWPWSRTKVSQLVNTLFEQGATVVAFDVMFSEPERNIATQVFQRLNDQGKFPETMRDTFMGLVQEFDSDALLAHSLTKGDVVLGYVLHNEHSKPAGALPPADLALSPEDAKNITLPQTTNYTADLQILQNAAKNGGFTTSFRDEDGVVRRAPLILQYGNNVYGSLALEAAKLYLLADHIQIDTHNINGLKTIEGVYLDKTYIPTDARARVLVPFHGPRRTFSYLSATQVLHKKIPAQKLAGKIVLVGTSALGLADLQSTAVQNIFPGVEVHANIIAGILEKRFPYEPAWATGANFALLAVSGLLLSFILAFTGPMMNLFFGALALFAEIGFNAGLWIQNGLALTVVTPILLILMLVTMNLAYGFLFENRRKRQITHMFGQYVSSDIVEEMSKNPSKYTFEGVSREMTVLFADIRSFTTISEKLTAMELKDLLNHYFEPMTEIIFNNGGTIDKYVGDMIMAFWGAPREDEDQALHAVLAAQAMLLKSAELRIAFAKQGLPEINIGVGLNSGIMNVGDMGSKYRRAYTVLGDAVNLGSRLEASTKFYGVDLLIGPSTYEQLETIALRMAMERGVPREKIGLLCRKCDDVKVKGKETAVAVYAPVCGLGEPPAALLEELYLHNEGLTWYLNRDWEKAEQRYQELSKRCPDVKIYQMYSERIQDLKNTELPEDWDGAFVRAEK